jgi:hypothetical protein
MREVCGLVRTTVCVAEGYADWRGSADGKRAGQPIPSFVNTPHASQRCRVGGKIMNTNSKKTTVFGAIVAATALLASVGPASAGGPTHRMPANYGKPHQAYEIKIVSIPTAGHMLTVQLVNKQTDKIITDADVSMQHWVWKGMKAVPQTQMALVSLETDGHGDFVCSREHVRPEENVVLRAHVSGEPSRTWTTLTLNS